MENFIIKIFIAISLLLFSARIAFASGAVQSGATAAMGGVVTVHSAKETKRNADLCTATPSKPSACFMAALYGTGTLAGAVTMKSALDSKKGFSNPGGVNPEDFSLPGGQLPNPEKDPGISAINTTLATLPDLQKAIKKETGLDADFKKGTLSGPKGSVDLGNVQSGQDFVKAGLVDEAMGAEIDRMLAANRAAGAKLKIPNMTSAAGGGYSPRGTASVNYEDSYSKYRYGMEKETPNAPKTAGLVKIAGGETIGAQTDNIFEMLHRKYQQKSSERIFVGQEP